MRKILSFILCVIMTVSVLTLTGCKDKNAVGLEWQVKNYTTTVGSEAGAVVQKVGFKVTRGGTNIKDVWVNVREIEGENAKFTFCKYKTYTSNDITSDLYVDGNLLNGGPVVVTAQQVKDANKTAKGWIKINTESWAFNNDNVMMSIPSGVTLREIVFVGENDKVLTAEIYRAYVVVEVKVDRKEVKTYLKEFTKAELLTYAGTAVCGIPNFLLDNQEAFATRNSK